MSQVTYVFPSANELLTIEQSLKPTLVKDNPAFQILPEVDKPTPLLVWEQMDNFTGMMQARGLNGPPSLVKAVGSKQYSMTPGVYGEFMTLNEMELTLTRQPGTWNEPIDVTDLVLVRANQLLHRQIKRQIWLIWQLLTKGYYLVTDANGVLHDGASYAQRVYVAPVAWSNLTSAAPMADFRAVKPLGRGYSVSFGGQSVAYANGTTIRNCLSNNNPADLGGKRLAGGGTFNSMSDMNNVLGVNDLPRLVEWEGGWQDDAGNFNLDIPDGIVVVKGVRVDGGQIGNFINTKNVNNPGFAPGPYYQVFQTPTPVPANVEIHRGVNGGPVLFFPSAIVVMKV